MFFKVEYDSDDQNINLPDDLNLRLEKLRELKKRGQSQIKDKWMTL